MYPFDTPWIMWQLVHGLLAKIFAPVAATRSLCGGFTGPASWALSHAAKFSVESTNTRKRMFACERPQNSAHCPGYIPAVFAINVSWLIWPGTTSRLPPSCGTQKLWMISPDCNSGRPGQLIGMCNSLLVLTPSGYSNSHHH